MMLRLTNVILLIISCGGIYSQNISGYVREKDSQESVPFANIWVKGTIQGITADENGYFVISNPQKDTLCASSIGYNSNEIKIKRSGDQSISIYLKKEVQQIEDVTVNAKMPITKVIFKRIQQHKKSNQEQVKNTDSYKSVENTTVYVAIDTTSKVSHIFNDINEVTVQMDDQKLRFSPVYLFEQARRVDNKKDSVVFSKKDGIFPRLNQAIETYILQNVVVDFDFYKDQIFIMDRGFISPISSTAMMYYNLYFNDSTRINDKKYYHFTFAPKNRYNALFSGNFVVEEGNYALTEINVHIPKEANLNFVNGFSSRVSYQQLPDGGWFYDEQQININMSLTLNKDTAEVYDSQRIDNVSSGNWLINRSTIYSRASALDKIKPSEWTSQPEFESSQLKNGTYERVENLKDNKYVKGVDAIGGMALSSYLNAGKLDIGPVFDIYSTNTIEGQRLTIPLRTSEKMFDNFYVGGFLGYGTKSEAFKYGVNAAFRPLDKDKFILRVSYSDDYNLVAQDKYLSFIKNNPNTKGNSNFIASFTTKEKNPYLKEEKSAQMRFEYNAKNDLHIEASPYYLKSYQTPDVKFMKDGFEYKDYVNYGVLMNFRYAFKQNFDLYFFDRIYYSTPVPVVNFAVDIGQTLLPDGEMSKAGIYAQLHGSVQGRLVFGQVFMNYMVNGGYLVGDAPYDLLDQPFGSMSLGYSKYGFNLLHHASFAHNAYTNTHMHINGGGILLNRVPLIRKLKLREVVSFKGHYGVLSNSYHGVFDLPDYYSNDSSILYAEIGFGLTNIFKVLRVEYTRLLGNTYGNKSYTDKNGIFFRAEMSF